MRPRGTVRSREGVVGIVLWQFWVVEWTEDGEQHREEFDSHTGAQRFSMELTRRRDAGAAIEIPIKVDTGERREVDR